MATKKSPLARQKDEHESKEKLVDRVLTVLGAITKSDEDKDTVKARLLAASNKKLIRLHEVGSEIKSKFGSMEKLAEAVGSGAGPRQGCAVREQAQALHAGAPARHGQGRRKARQEEGRLSAHEPRSRRRGGLGCQARRRPRRREAARRRATRAADVSPPSTGSAPAWATGCSSRTGRACAI